MSAKKRGKSASEAESKKPKNDFIIYNPQDHAALQTSRIGIFISVLIFLFGTNIVEKLVKLLPNHLPESSTTTTLEGIIACLNILLAAYVLLDLWKIRPVKSYKGDSIIALSFKQLLRGWRCLWITWLLFYSCLAILWLRPFELPDSVWYRYIADALNMVNGFFFYYLFFVLDMPSVPTEEKPQGDRQFKRNTILVFILGILALLGQGFFGWLYGPKEGDMTLIDKLVAAYIAIGMAFFVGRLDSHHLKVNRIILAPLYLYAIIQLFWGRNILGLKADNERVAIFALALILKFVIFVIISTWIRNNRFRPYFVEIREKYERDSATEDTTTPD